MLHRRFRQDLQGIPGIASGLHKRLRSLAVSSGMPELAAAYLADTFFKQPNIAGLKDSREASEKLGCWEAVWACLFKHLQTGKVESLIAQVSTGKLLFPKPARLRPILSAGILTRTCLRKRKRMLDHSEGPNVSSGAPLSQHSQDEPLCQRAG